MFKFTFFLLLFFNFFNQPVNNADFIIPVEIDGTVHQVMPASCVCSSLKIISCLYTFAIRCCLSLKGFDVGCSESGDIPMGWA